MLDSSTLKSPRGADLAVAPFLAPLDLFLRCRSLADRVAPTSLSGTVNTVRREKVVWLLLQLVMSYPDFVCWPLVSVCVCVAAYVWACVWRTYKLKEWKGWKRSFQTPTKPSFFYVFFFLLTLLAENPLVPPRPRPLVKILRKQPPLFIHRIEGAK